MEVGLARGMEEITLSWDNGWNPLGVEEDVELGGGAVCEIVSEEHCEVDDDARGGTESTGMGG